MYNRKVLWLLIVIAIMFEMQAKRSGRSQGQRKHSTSNNHLPLKDPLKVTANVEKRPAKIHPQQKILVEASKTEG